MKKKISKDTTIEYKKNIPDNIKVLFGKFTLFSIIYILFLGVLFPCVLINHLSIAYSFLLLITLIIFYIYIVYDVIKNKGNFNSTNFVFLIIIVIVGFIISFYKLIQLY